MRRLVTKIRHYLIQRKINALFRYAADRRSDVKRCERIKRDYTFLAQEAERRAYALMREHGVLRDHSREAPYKIELPPQMKNSWRS